MKLIIDMNLSPRWIDSLEAAGFEAVHWTSIGPHNAPDAEIMAYAANHGYVVLTHDLDFGSMLAATNNDGPSVVQIRAEDLSPDVIGIKVIAALRQMATELREGALLTVDSNRTRVKVLPFRSKT
jgi:predicted nuclease of predicted toxin-antitoxin system